MKQLILALCLLELTLSVYPTGCKKKGYHCVFDGIKHDKYFECNEFYEGIRTCPRNTKCISNAHHTNVIPCEFVKEEVMDVLPVDVINSEFECKADGFYCVIDGLHDRDYYECSPDFNGFRHCALGTHCRGAENNPYNFNPCVVDEVLISSSTKSSSEYPSQEKSSTGVSSEERSYSDISSSEKKSSEEPTTPSTGVSSEEHSYSDHS
ncbi:cyst wall-specific glycoprotein Jacob, putative, partial [Entamoeba histolytica HM-3:IMSS]